MQLPRNAVLQYTALFRKDNGFVASGRHLESEKNIPNRSIVHHENHNYIDNHLVPHNFLPQALNRPRVCFLQR